MISTRTKPPAGLSRCTTPKLAIASTHAPPRQRSYFEGELIAQLASFTQSVMYPATPAVMQVQMPSEQGSSCVRYTAALCTAAKQMSTMLLGLFVLVARGSALTKAFLSSMHAMSASIGRSSFWGL